MDFISDHTCIKVTNLEKSKTFYHEALGFVEKVLRQHTPEVTSVFVKAPNDGMQLQLLYIPGCRPDHLAYGHFGMRTEDIEASYAYHQAMGCTTTGIQEQPHQFGYFIQDPDGYETEIIQEKV
jgi:catechol 2,3-dioxygenase-like lactoylglutathione lyase family enzyme